MGANTVIFSVVEGVLLKPLPYPHAEQLIGVWHTAPGIGIKELNMSPSIYFIDREQNTTLQDIGAYAGDSLNVTGAGKPEHVPGLDVTDGMLPILGVAPARGTLIYPQGRFAGCAANRSALLRILATEVWRRIFRHWALHHRRRKAERNHRRAAQGISLSRSAGCRACSCLSNGIATRPNSAISVRSALARLKPGVTMAQASADMARLLPVVLRSFPAPEGFSSQHV